MFVVGLTGGIGSGKTTVANLFADLGVDLVDADELSRVAVEPGTDALAAIAEKFGKEILTPQGSLARSELRKIVFADAEKRQWLEELLHPIIGELIVKRIAQCRSPYCLLVSPLLLETSQSRLVDRILVIDLSESSQLERTMQRDGSDRETIEAIIASQMKREQRLLAADDVLDNESDRDSLAQRVASLHQKYLELSSDYEHA
ncbi:MAG: dephospho-CoA kinase [Gammaproteobacteria bacterium]|nr:coaE [Symbiodinium microadriaticum]